MKTGRIFSVFCVLSAIPVVFACCARKTGPLLAQDYSSWKTTHTEELQYPIPGHENTYRRIFISPGGERPEIVSRDGETRYAYPEGTQVIKEIYAREDGRYASGPSMLTAMVKRKDHPAARGGWLWILTKPGSGEETIISEEFCITCHANANEKHPYGDRNPKGEFRDYLFFPFPPPAR